MSDASIVIRTCQLADLPVVKALMEQLGENAHLQSLLTLERLQQIAAEMDSLPQIYLNLVCVQEEVVVGFLSLIFYRTFFHQGGTALINELVGDRQQRGRGFGAHLIEAAIFEARVRGMDEIEVGTEKANLEAQKFYHRAGFDEEYLLLGMEFEENNS
jgi:GNAT superfamily N-acetyltransferase